MATARAGTQTARCGSQRVYHQVDVSAAQKNCTSSNVLLFSIEELLPLAEAPGPSLTVWPPTSVCSSALSLANSAATRDAR